MPLLFDCLSRPLLVGSLKIPPPLHGQVPLHSSNYCLCIDSSCWAVSLKSAGLTSLSGLRVFGREDLRLFKSKLDHFSAQIPACWLTIPTFSNWRSSIRWSTQETGSTEVVIQWRFPNSIFFTGTISGSVGEPWSALSRWESADWPKSGS